MWVIDLIGEVISDVAWITHGHWWLRCLTDIELWVIYGNIAHRIASQCWTSMNCPLICLAFHFYPHFWKMRFFFILFIFGPTALRKRFKTWLLFFLGGYFAICYAFCCIFNLCIFGFVPVMREAKDDNFFLQVSELIYVLNDWLLVRCISI